MKTLHVHIGTPKTGTTSIQNFCVENAEVLEKKGYCYPLFPFVYPRVAKVRNGHFLTDVEHIQDGMQKVKELFFTYDNIILSDESIWRSMELIKKNLWEELKEIAQKENFQIRVVVYLRRQDKFLCSLWNQQLKSNIGSYTVKDFKTYIKGINKKIRFDYYSKLEKIAGVIGKECVIVRRFESDRFYGGNIYADFLQAIGLELSDEFLVSKGMRNQGLYGNTHEIKRVLNSLPEMKDVQKQNFLMYLLRDCSEISAKNYPCEMFSKEETEEFLKQYEEGNRKIAEEYLHEPGAELFDPTVEDLPKWQKDNPYMYEDIIRFVGSTSLYLYEENKKLKEELQTFEYNVRHPFKTLLRRIKRKLGLEKLEEQT